ncbi:MAG TPA: hypothetical protein VM032_01410 [Vicinamibacterales bacterium]|nr:hypothetical protein [Vicinamibacterales bacterium]
MQIYHLRLAVAAANSFPADEVLRRLEACLATFEAGRSDEAAHRCLAAKATLHQVASVDGIPDRARGWLLSAMRQVGKRRASDLVEDQREAS